MNVSRLGHVVLAATFVAAGAASLISRAAWLTTPAISTIAGVAIAVFGLPHGTLDIEILTRSRRAGMPQFTRALTLYLICAATMALLWWVTPIAALGLFMLVAVVHFGEDWSESGSAFFQHGMALALLSAPALFHRSEIAAIFVALTGTHGAALAGDLLLMAAPVSGLVALVAIASMAVNGARATAAAAAISLVALTALPPVPGFAVYFCVFHSPRHFRAALRLLGWLRPWQWLPVVIPVTAAALAITTALFLLVPATGVPARLVAAVFMTLSVLTLPHLAVPLLLQYSRTPQRLPVNPLRD